MPLDGCPQRCSFDWCVMHTWWMASLRVSQSGVELVMTIPRSGWGLDCVVGRRDRTGGGGFVFGGGIRLNRIFLTEMTRPMSYRVFSFARLCGKGSWGGSVG